MSLLIKVADFVYNNSVDFLLFGLLTADLIGNTVLAKLKKELVSLKFGESMAKLVVYVLLAAVSHLESLTPTLLVLVGRELNSLLQTLTELDKQFGFEDSGMFTKAASWMNVNQKKLSTPDEKVVR